MNASALPPPLPPAPRSHFVNVLAWIALGLCGVGLLLTIVQVAAFAMFSQMPAFVALRQQLMANPAVAASAATLSHWMPVMMAVSAAKCALAVIGAIGLLKRREWARRLFVALLAIAALWQCAAIAIQRRMTQAIGDLVLAMPHAATDDGARMQAQFAASLGASHLTGAVFGVAFIGVYAWLAWMLCTPRIRAEFAPSRDAIPL